MASDVYLRLYEKDIYKWIKVIERQNVNYITENERYIENEMYTMKIQSKAASVHGALLTSTQGRHTHDHCQFKSPHY